MMRRLLCQIGGHPFAWNRRGFCLHCGLPAGPISEWRRKRRRAR